MNELIVQGGVADKVGTVAVIVGTLTIFLRSRVAVALSVYQHEIADDVLNHADDRENLEEE